MKTGVRSRRGSMASALRRLNPTGSLSLAPATLTAFAKSVQLPVKLTPATLAASAKALFTAPNVSLTSATLTASAKAVQLPVKLTPATVTASPRSITPSTEAFPGDPGEGNYYVAWAAGPGGGTPARGSLTAGQANCQNKLAMYHNYSNGTNERVSTSQLDQAINAGLIASQSFKLATKGNETNGPIAILAGTWDSVIDGDADACKARAPWPIILCYYHEPGGNFTTTTMRANYRAAFRYIVNRYRARGVTNVCWTNIQEAPYDFRPTPFTGGTLGGSRGFAFRECHPDWNGGTTGTIADWYTGEDQVLDIFGLDIYNPLVNGFSHQPYDRIWRDVAYQWDEQGFPIENYGGTGIFEMGWSDIIDPDPDWVAYAAATLVEQSARNIKIFTYWNNNNDTPPRYDMAATGNVSDVDGDKYAGWQDIVDGAVGYPPPPPSPPPPSLSLTDTAEVLSWISGATPRASATTLDWNAGDLVLVIGSVGDETSTLGVPTATGLSFTQIAATANPSGDFTDVWAWVATAGASGSSLINVARTGGGSSFGFAAMAFSGHNGVGATATLTDTAKTINLTRVEDNSWVIGVLSGWSGASFVAPTGYSPATPDIIVQEGNGTSNTHSVHFYVWDDQGPAGGPTSYGMTSAMPGNFSKIAIEVKSA